MNPIRRLLWLVLVVLSSLPALTQAQGTFFTYQGRLNDNGSPANGHYDLRFSLYDASAGGLQLGGTINRTVDATNGLFSADMDFGSNFNGAQRWLQLEVRTNGGGSFTALSGRQEITPTPYAIYAGNSAAAATASTASNVVSGAVVTSLNSLKDSVTLAAGSNVTITPNGNSLTIASAGVGGSGIWSVLNNNAYYSAGNVGIGPSTAAHRLSIGNNLPAWTANGWGGAIELWNAGAIGWRANAAGQRFGIGQSSGGLYFFRTASEPGTTGSPANYDLMISDAGRVGIGTTTPAAKLTVRTTGAFSAYGIEHTDGDVRLSTYLDAGYGAWLGTRSAHALNFYVNDGLPCMAIDTSGNVVMTPNGGASGYGSTAFGAPNGESGINIRGYGASPNRADLRFNGSSIKLVAGPGTGPPSFASGIAVTIAGNVGIGTDTPVSKLDVRGNTRTCTITITGGCDLAEPFPMKEEQIEKGSVVVIDDEQPGQLKLSTRAYDTRVAGIVSGANGINTGIALQQAGVLDQGEPVALNGRVFVHADATFGDIKPGDLLTTSDTPGHAMKVTDHTKSQGAILGKAMSGLGEGKGFVLVLVTLQ
jgi:hypothetical protein